MGKHCLVLRGVVGHQGVVERLSNVGVFHEDLAVIASLGLKLNFLAVVWLVEVRLTHVLHVSTYTYSVELTCLVRLPLLLLNNFHLSFAL